MSEDLSAGVNQERLVLKGVEIRDGWVVKWQDTTLVLDYEAVPLERLQRKACPGIEVNYIGKMWMLSSHDSIGEGLGIEHQGILNHGKTVDCQHLDDTIEAVQHGMKRIEMAVGEELADGHKRSEWPYGD